MDQGHRVLCVDNLSTGRMHNIEQLSRRNGFEIMDHDITQPIHADVDEIYNLACPASPAHYQRNPVKTMKTSILGSLNLLGLAKRLKAPIFQASTSEIYGDPEQHPQTESYRGSVNTLGPRACYDEGKRCAETLFYDYQRQHGLDVRVARVFNTYGPRMLPDDGRVVSNFIVQALSNLPITIFGDGSQTRSLCYVDDLVGGFIKQMEHRGLLQGPINLGNPNELTIRELAELIIELTGSRSRIESRPLPQDDPRRRCPDISKARSILNWHPEVSLRDGMKRTIAYFQAELAYHSDDAVLARVIA
jgi:UDP-glucuronate decarboxylase